MGFDKPFFENIGELLKSYFKVYPCGVVTLTIRAYDQEYNVVRFLRCDERLLTFVFFCDEKSHEFPQQIQEKIGELRAWPALTVPYEAILSVEFNPGKAAIQKEIGFKPVTSAKD